MVSQEIEDEALVLAAAAFSGREAGALLGALAPERAQRCTARLHALTAGNPAQRRARLGAALRERFSPVPAALLHVPAARIAERLAGERPAVLSLVLADLGADRAAEVAALLGIGPTRPAAPTPAVHTWLRKRLLGDLAR